jgi:hypothetical protein
MRWFLNTLIMKNVHAYESLMGIIVMFWNKKKKKNHVYKKGR